MVLRYASITHGLHFECAQTLHQLCVEDVVIGNSVMTHLAEMAPCTSESAALPMSNLDSKWALVESAPDIDFLGFLDHDAGFVEPSL